MHVLGVSCSMCLVTRRSSDVLSVSFDRWWYGVCLVRLPRYLMHALVANIVTWTQPPWKHVSVYMNMCIPWCQEGWHDISCHVCPRTVPRTALVFPLPREDARAIINLKPIEWVRCLAGHVPHLAFPLRRIIPLLNYLHCRATQYTFPRCVRVFWYMGCWKRCRIRTE